MIRGGGGWGTVGGGGWVVMSADAAVFVAGLGFILQVEGRGGGGEGGQHFEAVHQARAQRVDDGRTIGFDGLECRS